MHQYLTTDSVVSQRAESQSCIGLQLLIMSSATQQLSLKFQVQMNRVKQCASVAGAHNLTAAATSQAESHRQPIYQMTDGIFLNSDCQQSLCDITGLRRLRTQTTCCMYSAEQTTNNIDVSLPEPHTMREISSARQKSHCETLHVRLPFSTQMHIQAR